MLSCYIEGRNIPENSVTETEYEITEGAVFTENHNETLDTGSILLQQLDSKIEIEPYDVVVILSRNSEIAVNTRRMCVDTVTCTQISLNPPIYRYQISLFSETKLLEGIVCPSLKITKIRGREARSVYIYLDNYLALFGTKTDFNPITGDETAKFSLGSDLERFRTIPCPEMQWNQPTLREVFTDLMMVDDCIPVVRNNVIGCIDISEIGSELTADEKKSINYITESQSAEDYVSDIKMHLVNAANNSDYIDNAAISVNGESYADITTGAAQGDATTTVSQHGFLTEIEMIVNSGAWSTGSDININIANLLGQTLTVNPVLTSTLDGVEFGILLQQRDSTHWRVVWKDVAESNALFGQGNYQIYWYVEFDDNETIEEGSSSIGEITVRQDALPIVVKFGLTASSFYFREDFGEDFGLVYPMDPGIPRDATRIVERIGFRNNDSYLLTTENMLLQTSFPIWKLFYCKIYFIPLLLEIRYLDWEDHVQTTLAYGEPVELILKDGKTNYILEHSEWLTKNVFYGAWGDGPYNLSTDYRNTCLFYTRGSKNIENFNDYSENQMLFIRNTVYVFDLIINSDQIKEQYKKTALKYLNDNHINYKAFVSATTNDVTYKSVSFEVAYEPISDCTFSASKTPFPRNRRQIVDNQTNSYIDVNRQGTLEYLKANRLGNKVALVNGRFQVAEKQIPDLARKINDKIIFSKEIAVYDKHIDVNYQAAENYVLRNYFTGVKSKLRSWRVLSGGEALTRSELVKFYVNSTISSVRNEYRVIPSYTSIDDYMKRFLFCAIRFRTSDGWIPKTTDFNGRQYDTDAIMVEFTKHRVGNSVVFTINMNDNYYAGNYVSNYDSTDHRVEQKGVRYTDDNGEFIDCEICFYSDFTPDGFYDNNNLDEADRGLRPLVSADFNPNENYGKHLKGDDMVAKIPMLVIKDNGEIFQVSIQFEINPEANDMFIGYK